MSDIEQMVRAIVRDELAKAKPEPGPDDASRLAELLVRMLWLYPNYRVDSRGPAGCIVDALEIVAPDIAAQLKDGVSVRDIYQPRWGEDA